MRRIKLTSNILSVTLLILLSSCAHYISTGHGYRRAYGTNPPSKLNSSRVSNSGHSTRDDSSSNNSYVGLKALRIAPVDHYFISSKFGYRYHPIKHKRILHTGVDYAVGHNTPIHATARGSLIFKGWKTGYGNTIMIKHNHTYTTLYAHMDHFASNINVGDHIDKYQVIGYVGKTGYATGYHVHYEVRKDNKPINPLP